MNRNGSYVGKVAFVTGAGDGTAHAAALASADGTSVWSAVGSMALCVALLIAAEFRPVSLLTPIANDLGATVGMAGQAISTSGLFAVLTSLYSVTFAAAAAVGAGKRIRPVNFNAGG